MLKTYEVAIENGQVLWLDEKPEVTSGRALLTILEENNVQNTRRRSPSPSIAGKGRTLGDIVSPIVDEEDWECLK